MLHYARKVWRVIKRYPHITDVKTDFIELGDLKYGAFGVAKDYLRKQMTVMSFGVGFDISFDEALIDNYNAIVWAFDPTPKVAKWISENQNVSGDFHFFPYGLSTTNGSTRFYLPDNEDYVSGSIVGHEGVQSSRCSDDRF